VAITDLRFPKTALIKMSCTCSCLTRKLHNRRTGAADACLGLDNKFMTQFTHKYCISL
jgi:ABC-type thiamine transport system substrate-binding protein